MRNERQYFDFVLLDRMLDPYKSLLATQLGLTNANIAELAQRCELKYPDLMRASLDDFQRNLIPLKEGGSQPSLREYGADISVHRFMLEIWPELCWTVYAYPDGSLAGAEIQNCSPPRPLHKLPKSADQGQWTRLAVKKVSQSMDVEGGWDEHIIYKCEIDSETYIGEFVFGLLQRWEPAR